MSGLKRLCLLGAVLVTCLLVALTSKALSQRTSPAPAVATAPSSHAPARTEAGAVAAAVDVLRVFGSPRMYDSRERSQILPSVAGTAVTAAEIDRGFELAARTLSVDARGTSPDGVLVSRLVPVGHRTMSFGQDRAEIAVWVVGLLGVAGDSSPVPVTATWTTETVTLEWIDQRWTVTGMRQTDGPTPVGSAQVPSPAEQIARAADQFTEPTYGE